jgi:hypothetical protein
VADKAKGYPVSGLVWNAERPNVSVKVRIDGHVRLPDTRPAPLPELVDSYIWRNYTVIRDGVVHTRKLPVSLAEATFSKLQANGLLAGEKWVAGQVYVLDFSKVPVINRKMVKSVTAKDTFAAELELAMLKGSQKVVNDYRNRITPKESAKFLLLYGETATEYLKELGVTDYNGFNPPGNTVKSGDFYMATELSIGIKGLSSLPKVVDVENAIDAVDADPTKKKKLKLGEFTMTPMIRRLWDFMTSPAVKDAADRNALLKTWLETEQKAIVKRTRELTEILAQRKFSIVVGHVWFSDLASMDDTTLSVELAGFGPVSVTAKLAETQIDL